MAPQARLRRGLPWRGGGMDCSARGDSPGPSGCRFHRKTTGPRLLRPHSDAAIGIEFVVRVAERLSDIQGSRSVSGV